MLIEVVPADVEGGRSFELPASAGDDETGPEGVDVFIGGAELGVSSTEEGSAGTIEVIDASCDPATVELTIDATLGSETYDGDDLEVVGNLNSP